MVWHCLIRLHLSVFLHCMDTVLYLNKKPSSQTRIQNIRTDWGCKFCLLLHKITLSVNRVWWLWIKRCFSSVWEKKKKKSLLFNKRVFVCEDPFSSAVSSSYRMYFSCLHFLYDLIAAVSAWCDVWCCFTTFLSPRKKYADVKIVSRL